MKITAIMPIKLKNERCPGKNIRLLGDKPLLQYELLNLKKTKLVDDIYVFCSDHAVEQYLPEGVTFLQREKRLDESTSNFTEIFSSFMKKREADIYVYAHATAPFISVNTMKECIEAVKNGEYDSAFCAQKIQTFLWQDNKPLNFDASHLSRTQDITPVYQETSGVYVFRKEVFDQYHRRVGIKPFIKCVDFIEAVDIDYPEDFQIAEAFLQTKNIWGLR